MIGHEYSFKYVLNVQLTCHQIRNEGSDHLMFLQGICGCLWLSVQSVQNFISKYHGEFNEILRSIFFGPWLQDHFVTAAYYFLWKRLEELSDEVGVAVLENSNRNHWKKGSIECKQ